MSKRRYHSIECKQVDWAVFAERVGGERVVLAIDVAKHDFVATLQVQPGEILARIKWQHPRETRLLLSGVAQLQACGPVEAVMESSGTYGDALRGQLQVLGVAVYRVGAKRVHDAAEVFDGVPSLHDAKAAEIIGELHLQGRTQPWVEADARRRGLTAQRRRLRQCKTRYQADLNRLEALLSRHWPESLVIVGLGSLSLHQVLANDGGPARIQAHAAAARTLMEQVGRPGLCEETLTVLLDSTATTLGLPTVAEEEALLRWQATGLIETHRELRAIERVIEQAVAADAALTPMAEVVGRVTSAVLVASQGSPLDYPDARSDCKALGLNLKEHSSGTHQGRLAITKRGPSLARFYLYVAALRLIAHDPVVARWFQAKTARPGAIKGKQVVELMRKLAKALWHQAHGRRFSTDKLFNLSAVAGA
jgi:transposase